MRKIALVLVMLCVSLTFAQNNNERVKLKKVGDLVEATYFADNGSIEQHGFFKNNLRHGNWTSYNVKGEKVVIGYYANGKKTGKWVFRTKGVLKEVEYLEDKIVNVKEWGNKKIISLRE